MARRCPVCLIRGEMAGPVESGGTQVLKVTCNRCGEFKVSNRFQAGAMQENPQDGFLALGGTESRVRSDLSAWIRQQEGQDLLLTYGFLMEDSQDPYRIAFDSKRAQIKTFQDRADRLLHYLGKLSKFAGQKQEIDDRWFSRAWALNSKELSFILSHLENQKLIEKIGNGIYRVTSKGWTHIELLKQSNLESSQGFIAMSFEEALTEVYVKAFKPAVEEAGYDAFRVDHEPHNDMIDNKIISEIRRSRFLVADLTDHKQGVYFEAGYAHGLNIPVLWTCREDQGSKTHFDARQFNQVRWTPEDLGKLREDLSLMISAVVGWGPNKPNLGKVD